MFSILYPTAQPDFTELAPYMEGLTEKQRIIFISTYLHIQSNNTISRDKAIQHAMMIVMKHRYDHLMYSPETEVALIRSVKA